MDNDVLGFCAIIQRSWRIMMNTVPTNPEWERARMAMSMALTKLANAPDLPMPPEPELPRLTDEELDAESVDPFEPKEQQDNGAD